MDKENLNGIPEEEKTEVISDEAVSDEEIAEEVQEETVCEEENRAEQADETVDETVNDAEEESEDSEETVEEDGEPAEICPVCGEREVAEDSNYCTECETKMLKRRIPFLAWLSAFIVLGFSVFAFVLVLLASAPSLQATSPTRLKVPMTWLWQTSLPMLSLCSPRTL